MSLWKCRKSCVCFAHTAQIMVNIAWQVAHDVQLLAELHFNGHQRAKSSCTPFLRILPNIPTAPNNLPPKLASCVVFLLFWSNLQGLPICGATLGHFCAAFPLEQSHKTQKGQNRSYHRHSWNVQWIKSRSNSYFLRFWLRKRSEYVGKRSFWEEGTINVCTYVYISWLF